MLTALEVRSGLELEYGSLDLAQTNSLLRKRSTVCLIQPIAGGMPKDNGSSRWKLLLGFGARAGCIIQCRRTLVLVFIGNLNSRSFHFIRRKPFAPFCTIAGIGSSSCDKLCNRV